MPLVTLHLFQILLMAIIRSLNAKKAVGEIINVGSGDEISVRELAFKIARDCKNKNQN